MCSNYIAVIDLDRLLAFFGVKPKAGEQTPADVWPLQLAPFIRLHEDGSSGKVITSGHFGLLPHFAREMTYGRKTYNARSETVDKLPSFRVAWRQGKRCIVPAEAVYEPCYESGRAVRHRIAKANGEPLGIAGIYWSWQAPDGSVSWTFAMLTIAGAGHPVYQRMHKPGDEKRMVLILDPADYDRWLQCPVAEAKAFFKPWAGTLSASAEPLPARPTKRARTHALNF